MYILVSMATKRRASRFRQCAGCICLNLRQTTRAVTQLYDRAFQPHGLRATQFQILVFIANCGPIHISDLADRLVMDRTTLTRDLGPLKKRGWVRVRSGQDRRTRSVTLTADGWRLLEQALPTWEKTQAQVVERLGGGRLGPLLHELSAAVSIARGAGGGG